MIRTQSIITFAGGFIYPYYLLFLKNLGNSYTKYGLAFAVFTISSAVASQLLSRYVDRHARGLLLGSSLGLMAAMLCFPWVMSYSVVIALQIVMGVCNAMQRMGEKVLLADKTEAGQRGKPIGDYHFWTTAASGGAILAAGYVIDYLTINVLFYVSALLYGISAVLIWRRRVSGRRGEYGIYL
nr:MFS transporter [Paenibacillus oenotherae]